MDVNGIKMPMMASLYDAAEQTGMSYWWLRNKCLDGTLVHVKSGNKIMVNMPLLLDYLNGKKGSDTDEVQNCSNS